MANITLITCDHCDARDRTDSPAVIPLHNIEHVEIKGFVGLGCTIPTTWKADLCSTCREELQDAITKMTRQQPQAAEVGRTL